jgi:metal-responsive CopG/Arc/MetJ family transcriptional regulator
MPITVSIRFPEEVVAEIDALAKKEHRSRSELIREAARLYVERRERRSELRAAGYVAIGRTGLPEQGIAAEIRAYRRSRTSKRG